MSKHQSVQWLVIYDIVDDHCRGQVFRYLKRQGIPVQYSVFAIAASNAQMGSMIAHLGTLIDGRADDVRAYCLPDNGWRATLGNEMLPTDIWIA